VEGAPLTASGDYADDYRVEVFQDFGSGNTECHKADFGKPPISNCVADRADAAVMGFAIDFDSQSRFEASEVEAIA
jgi:hypothetical protein